MTVDREALRLQMVKAMEYHRVEPVRLVLESGFDVSSVLFRDTKETALHHAARYHDVSMCQFLISSGAKIDAKDKYRNTPLSTAIDMSRSPEVVRTLLAAGADVRFKDKKNQTLLHRVAGRDDERQMFCPEVSQLLLDAGADLFALTAAKRTILHVSQTLGAWKFFTNAGLHPDYVADDAGYGYLTPLQYAIEQGWDDVVAYCASRGEIDLDQRTIAGKGLMDLTYSTSTLSILRSVKSGKEIAEVFESAEVTAPAPRREFSPI